MDLLMLDPFLPFELLPKPFYREKIKKELKRRKLI